LSEIFEQINKLLQNKDFSKAKQLAENIDSEVDKYNILGIIFYHENDLDRAVEMFKKALEIDPVNDDVLFNYSKTLFEKGDFFESWRYLTRIKNKTWEVFDLLGDTQLKQDNPAMAVHYYKKSYEISNIPELKKKYNILKRQHFKNKKISIFYTIDSDDSILNIGEVLSNIYEIRFVSTNDKTQIIKAFEWADIIWFEGIEKILVAITNQFPKNDKKIIVRVTSQFKEDFIKMVNWYCVDFVIFTNKVIRDLFLEKNEELQSVKCHLIHESIDVTEIEFQVFSNSNSNDIAIITDCPETLINIIELSYQLGKISESKIHIKLLQPIDEILNNHVFYKIKKLNLSEKIVFSYSSKNIYNFIEDKKYIFFYLLKGITKHSILFSLAKGLRTLISNTHQEAENIYPKELLFNSIDEAIKLFEKYKHKSNPYRSFIEAKFSLEREIKDIIRVLQELEDEITFAWFILELTKGNSERVHGNPTKQNRIFYVIKCQKSCYR
jgi:tetratricopeptide (TPR) repeat protein